jgi:hypothetical protein
MGRPPRSPRARARGRGCRPCCSGQGSRPARATRVDDVPRPFDVDALDGRDLRRSCTGPQRGRRRGALDRSPEAGQSRISAALGRLHAARRARGRRALRRSHSWSRRRARGQASRPRASRYRPRATSGHDPVQVVTDEITQETGTGEVRLVPVAVLALGGTEPVDARARYPTKPRRRPRAPSAPSRLRRGASAPAGARRAPAPAIRAAIL